MALGASGGKDSTVLAYVMKVISNPRFENPIYFLMLDQTLVQIAKTEFQTLNSRFDYGLELFLLSIDEGIKGYRDDSLQVRMAFISLS